MSDENEFYKYTGEAKGTLALIPLTVSDILEMYSEGVGNDFEDNLNKFTELSKPFDETIKPINEVLKSKEIN